MCSKICDSSRSSPLGHLACHLAPEKLEFSAIKERNQQPEPSCAINISTVFRRSPIAVGPHLHTRSEAERRTMRKTCLTLRSRHSKQSVCAVGQLKEDAATEKEEIADWISLLHEAVIDQLVREINSPAINLVSPGFDMWGNLSARVHAKSESKAKQLRWSMRKCLCNYCKTRRVGVWQTKGGTKWSKLISIRLQCVLEMSFCGDARQVATKLKGVEWFTAICVQCRRKAKPTRYLRDKKQSRNELLRVVCCWSDLRAFSKGYCEDSTELFELNRVRNQIFAKLLKSHVLQCAWSTLGH